MAETHSAWVVAAGALLVAMGLVGSYFALPQLVRNMVTEVTAKIESLKHSICSFVRRKLMKLFFFRKLF